jgi:2-polyprenyl-3-methyl-5-hydroxy-6-metoxy-1,4-benzoquinol methylase
MESGASIAAGKWDASHQVPNYRRRFLANIPWAQAYVHSLYIGGGSPFRLLKERLGPEPVESALELAAGRGDFAISLLKGGIAKRVTALDISAAAVKIAREKAAAQGVSGLSCDVADVNTIAITERYDLIAFSQSLHHVEALEHVLSQVRNALNPAGLFFVSDYIGPTRMQWTDEQLRIMNDVLSLLPAPLRMQIKPDGTDLGHPKRQIQRIPLETFERIDPSEAVRSGDIERVIRATFNRVEFLPLGGAISYEMFRMIAHNFDVEDANVRSIVRLVLYFEHELILAGRLPPCFGVFLCQS